MPFESHSYALPFCFHLETVATSSYISVTNTTIYSAGGPTAELHSIRSDGGFGEKIQQLQYVSDVEMSTTDRTRKALVRAIFYVIRRSLQGSSLLTQCTVVTLKLSESRLSWLRPDSRWPCICSTSVSGRTILASQGRMQTISSRIVSLCLKGTELNLHVRARQIDPPRQASSFG